MPIVTYLLRIAEARLPTDLLGEKDFGSQKKTQDWFSNISNFLKYSRVVLHRDVCVGLLPH